MTHHTILACDLDGTLVDSRGRYFDGALELLELWPAVRVGISSARPLRGLADVRQRAKSLAFICSLQGAHIITEFGSRREHSVPLEPQLVAVAGEVALRSPFELWLYTADEWFVSNSSPYSDEEAELVGMQPSKAPISTVDPHQVLKCVLVGLAELPHTEHRALRKVGAVITRSSDQFLEIVGPDTPTAKGIPAVLSAWGSPQRPTTVAVGNGVNDLEMLRYVDFGFTFEDTRIAFHPELITVRAAANGGLWDVSQALQEITATEWCSARSKRNLRNKLRGHFGD